MRDTVFLFQCPADPEEQLIDGGGSVSDVLNNAAAGLTDVAETIEVLEAQGFEITRKLHVYGYSGYDKYVKNTDVYTVSYPTDKSAPA